ncbi:MAG: hypothetical protein AAGG02_10295 [Cyanobacteria bacterium P01_H01_bin.15]
MANSLTLAPYLIFLVRSASPNAHLANLSISSDLFHDEALDYLLPGVSALDDFVGDSCTGFRSSSFLDDSLQLELERQEGERESKPSSQVQLELDVAVTEKLFSKDDIPQWQSAVKACLGSSAGQKLSLFELGNLCGLSQVETFLALLHSTAAGETALMETEVLSQKWN